jgi:hypothetical protein
MDKTIRRIRTQADIDEQQRETYRYWASVSPGERMSAVSELSMAAYSFKGMRFDVPGPRTLVRIKRP